ncbi:MAG: ABC transporter permease, partial [candidate division Zixibacteria bacterium]|nr:ABC transporter permease [candidate division Zixibacteria bacterium]
MRRILNLALKDLLLLWRDKFGLFWVVVFPLGFAIFFGSIFSDNNEGPRAIRIAVSDQDSTSTSAEFVSELEKSDALEVFHLGADAAKDYIRKGKLTGYVLIDTGFSDFNPFFSDAPLPVKIGVDPSRRAEAGYLQGIIMKLMFASFQKRMSDSQMMISNTEKALAGIENSTGLSDEQRGALTGLFTSLGDFYRNADSTILDGAQMGMGEIKVESVERATSKKSPRSAYDVS